MPAQNLAAGKLNLNSSLTDSVRLGFQVQFAGKQDQKESHAKRPAEKRELKKSSWISVQFSFGLVAPSGLF